MKFLFFRYPMKTIDLLSVVMMNFATHLKNHQNLEIIYASRTTLPIIIINKAHLPSHAVEIAGVVTAVHDSVNDVRAILLSYLFRTSTCNENVVSSLQIVTGTNESILDTNQLISKN